MHRTSTQPALTTLLVCFSLLCLSAQASEQTTLIINDTNEPPFTTAAKDGFLDIVATEAFRRIGVKLQLIKLPAERGLLNANAGIEDGDLTRIKGLEKLYPNLIRVPEKLLDWEFVAYSKNPQINADWPAIRKHSVGHITGWKIYEHHLQGAEHVVPVNGAMQMFTLLGRDRIDIALYARWMGQAYIKNLELKGIHQLKPVLAKKAMYIYLHKRHKPLVPRLAKALRALKQEGFYQRVQNEKLAAYRGKSAQ